MRIKEILKQFKGRFEEIPNDDPRSTVGARDLISVLVFCFTRDRGNFRTLECIRKYAESVLGTNLSRGGFWERLATKRLRKYLETLASSMVQKIAGRLAVSADILKVLNVKAILLLDSSSSSLPKDAKDDFPAPRNNVAPAAIKLHLCFDLFLGAVNWFQLTPATTHDRKGFPPLTSLVGKLIIFDLGYWDYLLLAQIKHIGGFFLSRIKTNASIKIVTVISGLPKGFEGWHLFDRRLPKRKSKIVEVIGSFSANGKSLFTARVIGFWNPLAHQYHWYVTNLDTPAELIYPLYRLRWQLELIFKAFKSSLRLADLPSANSNIIYTLVYSALIASMIAHPLAYVLALECKIEKKFAPSFQRAVSVLVQVAHEFTNFLLGRSGSLGILIDKLKLLKMELFDPNRKKRKTTLMNVFELAGHYG